MSKNGESKNDNHCFPKYSNVFVGPNPQSKIQRYLVYHHRRRLKKLPINIQTERSINQIFSMTQHNSVSIKIVTQSSGTEIKRMTESW